jgi:hypothetical protein
MLQRRDHQNGPQGDIPHATTQTAIKAQFNQQRLRLFQITRVEPVRKPAVNRSEQFSARDRGLTAPWGALAEAVMRPPWDL